MGLKWRRGGVFLAVVVFSIIAALGSGTALAANPNTPTSPYGDLALPEAAGRAVSAPSRGSGELFREGAMQIPEADLNLPTVDELLGIAPSGQESVVGTDSRIRVTNTLVYPSRAIAYLVVTFSNGSRGTCTGYYIGPRVLATAGHCVNGRGAYGWARSITVYPGRNGTSAPYGYTTMRREWSVNGWVTSGNWNFDYGAIQTYAYKGNQVGWFGYSWQSSNTFAGVYNVRGYPGDKPSGTLWTMAGYVNPVSTYRLYYSIDTAGGQSGSPLYKNTTVGPYAAGIHTYGNTSYPYNSATRITQGAFNNLTYWKNYPY